MWTLETACQCETDRDRERETDGEQEKERERGREREGERVSCTLYLSHTDTDRGNMLMNNNRKKKKVTLGRGFCLEQHGSCRGIKRLLPGCGSALGVAQRAFSETPTHTHTQMILIRGVREAAFGRDDALPMDVSAMWIFFPPRCTPDTGSVCTGFSVLASSRWHTNGITLGLGLVIHHGHVGFGSRHYFLDARSISTSD